MGKVLENDCEFCMSVNIIPLPTEVEDFMEYNGLGLTADEDADADEYIIIDYPMVRIDKKIVMDYLSCDEQKLIKFLEEEYLVSDFDEFPDFLNKKYPNIAIEDCILDREKIINDIIQQLEDDFEYDPDGNNNEVYRVIFRAGPDEEVEAVRFLDEASCWYEWDNGNRLMLHKDGLNCLAKNGIDYDEV